MSIKLIISGFLTVVLALIGLGVWGWYASDDSRAEVARIRAERRLLIFCQEYRGVEFYAGMRFGFQAEPGFGSTTTVPVDPGEPVAPTSIGPDQSFPGGPAYEDYESRYMDFGRFTSNAPAGIAEEIEILDDADELSDNIGPAAFETPEVRTATARILEYGERHC